MTASRRQEVFQREALAHMDALYRYARRLTGKDRDAEDLVQDTYLRALRFFSHYQEGTNCKAWLLKIMHNLYINRWQSRLRQPAVDSLEDSEEWYLYNRLRDHQQYADNPERAFFERNWSPDIKEAIDRLPEEFRAPLLLCDVEGLSYQEIAEVLGIPIGTVRSRLNRARARLQKYLWEYAREDLALPERHPEAGP